MNVTLKDVANATGMSIRSVRRALENSSGISEASRRRIAGVARELGYVPNIAARNLRMRRTPFVGLISSGIGVDVFMRRRFDLIDKLESAGYNPLIARPPVDAAEADALMRRWTGITDVVIWQNIPGNDILTRLPDYTQRFILIDADFTAPNCCSCAVDRAPGITAAIEALIVGGRRRIVRCGRTATRDEGFRRAFEHFCHLAPESLGVIPVTTSDFDGGFAAAPEIMRSGADAVFFDVDRLAYGFLRYAYEHGIAVPGDIAVIGFDDDSFSRFCCPALSSVAHPLGDLNDRIVELVRSEDSGGRRFDFSTAFIERASSKLPSVAGGRDSR